MTVTWLSRNGREFNFLVFPHLFWVDLEGSNPGYRSELNSIESETLALVIGSEITSATWIFNHDSISESNFPEDLVFHNPLQINEVGAVVLGPATVSAFSANITIEERRENDSRVATVIIAGTDTMHAVVGEAILFLRIEKLTKYGSRMSRVTTSYPGVEALRACPFSKRVLMPSNAT